MIIGGSERHIKFQWPQNSGKDNNNNRFEKKIRREDTEQNLVSDEDDDDNSQSQSSAESDYSYQAQAKRKFFDKKGYDGNPFQADTMRSQSQNNLESSRNIDCIISPKVGLEKDFLQILLQNCVPCWKLMKEV